MPGLLQQLSHLSVLLTKLPNQKMSGAIPDQMCSHIAVADQTETKMADFLAQKDRTI